MGNYQIVVISNTNRVLRFYQNFISIEYGQKKNDVGACSLIIPNESYDVEVFKFGSMIEIWREDNAGNLVLVGETAWFLFKWKFDLAKNYIELMYYDLNWLLTRRVSPFMGVDRTFWQIIYSPNSYPYFDPAQEYQSADDIAKFIIRFNYTEWQLDPVLQDTLRPESVFVQNYVGLDYSSRINQWVQVDPFLGIFSKINAFEFYVIQTDTILVTLQRLARLAEASGTPFAFRFKYVPMLDNSMGGNFVFQTSPVSFGQDKTDLIILNSDTGMMENVTFEADYENFYNAVYSQGVDWDKFLIDNGAPSTTDNGLLDYMQATAYDYNLITAEHTIGLIEKTIVLSELPDNEDLFLLEQDAIDEVINSKPIVKFNGTAVQQNNMAFFEQYVLGDIVTVNFNNYDFACEITSYTVTVESDSTEKIKIKFDATLPINQIISNQGQYQP